jgi:peroxiredoxin
MGLHQGLPALTQDPTICDVKLVPDGAAMFTRGMGMSSMWVHRTRLWRAFVAVFHTAHAVAQLPVLL